MIHPINHLPQVIPIGVQTETGVEVIGFDLKPWMDILPDMRFTIFATRPGEDEAYPVKDQMTVGTVLYWHPDGYDTEIAGQGLVEIAGVCEDLRKASGFVQTSIRATSLGKTKEPGESVAPWYEAILKAADDVSADLNAVKAEIPGILLVRIGTGNVSSHTQQEVKDAYFKGKTGKAVQAIDPMGRVYTMTGVENGVPTFTSVSAKKALGGNRNPDVLIAYTARLLSDNTFSVGSPNYSVTPNPYALRLIGAVNVIYDGSENVTVEIPQGGSGEGVPDPGQAHQQLVSDSNGKAVWKPRLAYKVTEFTTLLPEMTLAGADGQMYLMEPPTALPQVGSVCVVTYNGMDYDCPAVAMSDNGLNAVLLGDVSLFGATGGNADAPFCILFAPPEGIKDDDGTAIYGIVADKNGATSATLSISGDVTSIKRLDADLIVPQVMLTVGDDNSVTSNVSMGDVWPLTPAQMQNAITIKRTTTNGKATEWYTVDSIVKRELTVDGVVSHVIQMRVKMQYIEDISPTYDTVTYIYWMEAYNANGALVSSMLDIESGWTFGGLPMYMANSGGQAGTYLRHTGDNKWETVTVEQMKQDLGIGGATPAAEDVFYTDDGQ